MKGPDEQAHHRRHLEPFRRLMASWTGSLVGDGLRVIALPLLAASIDPSPGAVALVATATALPWLLIAIPAGAAVDRWDARMALWCAHLVRALLTLTLAALVFGDNASIATLCVAGFAITAAETVADAASQTLLLRIVPHPELEWANARFVTIETLALDMAGPLAAGVLFVVASWLPFALSGVCFVAAAGAVLSITLPVTDDAETSASSGSTGGSTDRQGAWASVREGLRQLMRDRVLRTLVVTVALMVIANAATDAVLVVYGTETLQMSDALYPTLLVSYSIGTLLAAALVGRVIARFRGGQAMMGALFGIAASMVVLGVSASVPVAWAAFLLMGLAGGTWNVLSATRRQRRTPRDMIGRVSSAFRVVAWGMIPLGAALGGVAGERFGVPAVFWMAGLGIAVVGAVMFRSFVTIEPDPLAEPPSPK